MIFGYFPEEFIPYITESILLIATEGAALAGVQGGREGTRQIEGSIL